MYNKKTKSILLSSILAIATVSILFGIGPIIAEDNEIAFDKTTEPEQKIITQIDKAILELGETETYNVKFLQESKLYDLGANWKVLSVDHAGSSEPFTVEDIIVTARLVESTDNARQCEYGTKATIIYDAKTGDVKSKDIPTLESECLMTPSFGRPTESANLPDFIPQALGASDRSFLIAGQGSSSGHYGGYGKIKVPTLDETANPDSIYNEMSTDAYIGYLYNQDINNEFMQIGWTVTQGTTSYGPAGKYLIYVDEYSNGDYDGTKITSPTWSNDGDATVYIQCGTADDYYIYLYHNSGWFTHDTDMDCDNTTTSSSLNNSVFLENINNTAVTSDWSDEVETSVKAWNMKEFETKVTTSNWNSASNTYENCPSGTGSTSYISSSLGSGGTSVWTVSGIDRC